MILAGCVSIPDTMSLGSAPAPPQRVALVDDRPPDKRMSRVKVDTLGQWIYLGDDYFSPPPIHLLSSFLDERMPSHFADKPVVIKEIETLVTVFGYKPPPMLTTINTPAAIVGAVIGQALSEAIHRRHTFVSLVTVAIDGKEYSAGHSAQLSPSDLPSQIRDVLYASYHQLIEKLSRAAALNQPLQPAAKGS